MPGLASYEKKMRSAGVVILGVVKDSPKDKILDITKKAKVEFPIIDGARVPGVTIKAFPTYLLFNRNGELIKKKIGGEVSTKSGKPTVLSEAIEAALAQPANILIIRPEDFTTKKVHRLAKRAAKGLGLGRVLGQLDELTTTGSEVEQREAEKLQKTVLDYGQHEFNRAAELKQDSPHQYYDLMKDLAKSFRKHPLGDRAQTLYQTLRKDRAAKREIAASRLYEKWRGADAKTKNTLYHKMKRKYAETHFGRRVLDEMNQTADAQSKG